MVLASQGIIPNKYFHDPTLRDNNGHTVAMLLAMQGR